jgi:hypothetical protein
VSGGHAEAREVVEDRRLADVGVADERYDALGTPPGQKTRI